MEDWVVRQLKSFPDSREDVLKFICKFNSRSFDLYDVFASGYCYYFANMLKLAFNRGMVCWSAGRAHIVWLDDNDVAYDIGGVYYDYTRLLPVEYLGDSIVDFMHTDLMYVPEDKVLRDRCNKNNVVPILAIPALWYVIPEDKIDANSTIEKDIIKHFDTCVNSVRICDGKVFPK